MGHFAGPVIAVRAVMAVGAAIIMPIVLAVLTVRFTGPERSRAICLVVIGIGAGLPLGPIVGGHLLEHFWWAFIFLINVPVAAAMPAASAAAGRPLVSMRARYPADNRLPSRATPSAPATWRSAMVIAMPAPDGCGGRTARRPGRNAEQDQASARGTLT
ncbi:MFS transporter [Micromonospora sp. NPDC049204]